MEKLSGDTKWEYKFEDDTCVSIWKYNSKISETNPYEVEIRWKKNYNPWDKKKKTLGDLVKDQKKQNKL